MLIQVVLDGEISFQPIENATEGATRWCFGKLRNTSCKPDALQTVFSQNAVYGLGNIWSGFY